MSSIGLSPSIEAQFRALNANLVDEHGAILRTCEHGRRYVVGHVHGWESFRNALRASTPATPLCACHDAWLDADGLQVVTEQRYRLGGVR